MSMQLHIGVTIVNAKPMTRAEYNTFRGWTLPADEDGADAGFLVENLDGGRANTTEYIGYVSWSPADVFHRAYRQTNNMTFGMAIEGLKQGMKVARSGWNGKGMWLLLVPGTPSAQLHPGTPYSIALSGSQHVEGGHVEILPHIDMWTTNALGRRAMLPGWLASQTDMLSEDWEIVL